MNEATVTMVIYRKDVIMHAQQAVTDAQCTDRQTNRKAGKKCLVLNAKQLSWVYFHSVKFVVNFVCA